MIRRVNDLKAERALQRAPQWSPASCGLRAALPSAGQMLSAATCGSVDGEACDRALPQRQRESLV